jgi:pimeloyl-ACP methyl ester carboxylesterase
MDERYCTVGGIQLCYETLGDDADPVVLLVMGLGMQMVGWREDFCRQLVARGFRVVRFDNRDAGRSTHMHELPTPTRRQLLRRRVRAGYTLADMAGDAVGLLDHLAIERANVVGVSMGGMIAQSMAARHPQRVLSLTSIMSSSGRRWSGQPKLSSYPVLLRAGPDELEPYVEHALAMAKLIESPGFAIDVDEIRDIAATSWHRGRDRGAVPRQLAAIIASGDRTAELRRIRVPTVVIHGDRDRLIKISGGRATAKAIPDARLVVIEGMGHDLPRGVWPRLLDEIADVAERGRTAVGRPVETSTARGVRDSV